MSVFSIDSSVLSDLVLGNSNLLRQGRELVAGLSDEDYAEADPPVFTSSAGAHLRHVLDHYDSILEGARCGRVDYYERKRDPATETDRAVALARIGSTDKGLTALLGSERGDLLLRVSAEDADATIPTTLARELHFALSHTVHHYALIALACRHRGRALPDDFGVASSTLAHRRKLSVQG